MYTMEYYSAVSLLTYFLPGNYDISRKIDGTGDYNVKQDKPSSERHISCFHSHMNSRPDNNNSNNKNKIT
jgi:hypothetical protein